MQRLRFPLFALIAFGGVALALAALVAAGNSPKEKIASPALLLPSAARHETRTSLQEVIEFSNANEIAPRVETVSWAPPTRSSFMAWNSPRIAAPGRHHRSRRSPGFGYRIFRWPYARCRHGLDGRPSRRSKAFQFASKTGFLAHRESRPTQSGSSGAN